MTTRSRLVGFVSRAAPPHCSLAWDCARRNRATGLDGSARRIDGRPTPAPAAATRRDRRRGAEARADRRPRTGSGWAAFTFKPGGRVKLDVIRDFKPIGIRGFLRPAHDPGRRQRGHQLQRARQGDAVEPGHPRQGRGARAADVHRDRLLRQQQRAAPAPRLRLVGRPAGRSDVDARSWTKTTCRARSTSNRRRPSRSIRQAQVRWTQKLGGVDHLVGGRRGQQVDHHHPHEYPRQGRVPDARSRHALPIRPARAAT